MSVNVIPKTKEGFSSLRFALADTVPRPSFNIKVKSSVVKKPSSRRSFALKSFISYASYLILSMDILPWRFICSYKFSFSSANSFPLMSMSTMPFPIIFIPSGNIPAN